MANRSPQRPDPVRARGGLVAFAAVLVLPAILATGIVLGASIVADEVYAAEQPVASGATPAQAAEWKQTLVGICPLH